MPPSLQDCSSRSLSLAPDTQQRPRSLCVRPVWSWVLEVRTGRWCPEAPGDDRGVCKGNPHHTQETGPGREANTSFFIKASFLGRGVETFFRGLMAPGIKGIPIQKELSKRQPHPADRAEGCSRLAAGARGLLTSQGMGKGPAVSMQALGPRSPKGWHYLK